MGIMEKKMETTIWDRYNIGLICICIYIGLIQGLYRDNAQKDGNYCLGSRVWLLGFRVVWYVGLRVKGGIRTRAFRGLGL